MTFSENRNIKGELIFLFTTFFLISCSNPSQTEKNKILAGMYKLYGIQSQDSTGVWKEAGWANGGESYIIYDGLGHMALQITPKGYKDFKWLNEEESLDARTFQA